MSKTPQFFVTSLQRVIISPAAIYNEAGTPRLAVVDVEVDSRTKDRMAIGLWAPETIVQELVGVDRQDMKVLEFKSFQNGVKAGYGAFATTRADNPEESCVVTVPNNKNGRGTYIFLSRGRVGQLLEAGKLQKPDNKVMGRLFEAMLAGQRYTYRLEKGILKKVTVKADGVPIDIATAGKQVKLRSDNVREEHVLALLSRDWSAVNDPIKGGALCASAVEQDVAFLARLKDQFLSRAIERREGVSDEILARNVVSALQEGAAVVVTQTSAGQDISFYGTEIEAVRNLAEAHWQNGFAKGASNRDNGISPNKINCAVSRVINCFEKVSGANSSDLLAVALKEFEVGQAAGQEYNDGAWRERLEK